MLDFTGIIIASDKYIHHVYPFDEITIQGGFPQAVPKARETAAKRKPRRRKNFRGEDAYSSEKMTRNIDGCVTSSGNGVCSASDLAHGDDTRDDALLRFPGFFVNESGKECIGCYEAERVMFAFECEVGANSLKMNWSSLFRVSGCKIASLMARC